MYNDVDIFSTEARFKRGSIVITPKYLNLRLSQVRNVWPPSVLFRFHFQFTIMLLEYIMSYFAIRVYNVVLGPAPAFTLV